MPPTLTYPGVYIEEAPSSVHSITGVATSIAAFFGQAAMGPLNSPVECQSPSDYTRVFGGPVAGANLAQSVQQFFANGGSDCFVVRLADGAQPAQVMLNDINGGGVLQLTAASPGVWGAGLNAYVDYNTTNADATFNLTVENIVNGGVAASETFANLTLDPSSPRYAPTFITQSSQLITAASGPVTATGIAAGYSEARGPIVAAAGGWQAKLAGAWPAVGDQGSFQISVDNGPWTAINLSKATLLGLSGSDADTFTFLQTSINNALGAASGTSVTVAAAADYAGNTDFMRITSSGTLKSSVSVKTATSSDIASALLLGVNQGGVEVVRFADLRPLPNGISFVPKAAPNLNGEIATAMNELALAHVDDVTGITLAGTPIVFAWPAGNPQFNVGATPTDPDGVRENLQFIADTINSKFPGYNATVNGYRLSIENLSPPSANWTDTFSVQGGGANNFRNGFIANAQSYPFGQAGGGAYWAASGSAPSDGNSPTQADYLGNQLLRQGFYALDAIDIFNLMVLPGDGISSETEWQAIRSAAAVYCVSRRAFLLLDAPVGWTQNNLLTATVSNVQTFRQAIGDPDTNVAVFYPRVQINDQGTLRYMGPSGMIAGICAATDAAYGVWTAPAGTNAALTGATELEVILTDMQNGILNPQAVNCLRRMPAGYLVWGARTVAGFVNSGTQWTYIPVRRMALFLEQSLYQGTQWAVFQPNAEPLWAQIRMNISAFMMGLFQQNAFAGSTPSTAFFVKCDSETTTATDINNGVVNIVVGFAPLEPAEFVVITIQQINSA